MTTVGARKRAADRPAAGPRERTLPPRASERIQAKMTESARLRAEAQELIEATLEGMGLDIAPREDGLVWNVTDGEGGKLVARFGPRVSAMPDLEAIKKLVETATARTPEPPEEKPALS